MATLSSLTVRGDSATITLLSDPAVAPFGQPNCGTRLVNDPRLAGRLEQAYGAGVRALALDVPERETLLWALDNPPTEALAGLRGILLQEQFGRVRDGLASCPIVVDAPTGRKCRQTVRSDEIKLPE